jgi:hypothetical protein
MGRYEPEILISVEVVIFEGKHVPRLPSNRLKADGLDEDANGYLAQQGR